MLAKHTMIPINMSNRFGIIKHAENEESDIGTKLHNLKDEVVNKIKNGTAYVRSSADNSGAETLSSSLAAFGSGALITAIIFRNIARRKKIKELENRISSLEGNRAMNKSAGKILSRLGKGAGKLFDTLSTGKGLSGLGIGVGTGLTVSAPLIYGAHKTLKGANELGEEAARLKGEAAQLKGEAAQLNDETIQLNDAAFNLKNRYEEKLKSLRLADKAAKILKEMSEEKLKEATEYLNYVKSLPAEYQERKIRPALPSGTNINTNDNANQAGFIENLKNSTKDVFNKGLTVVKDNPIASALAALGIGGTGLALYLRRKAKKKEKKVENE